MCAPAEREYFHSRRGNVPPVCFIVTSRPKCAWMQGTWDPYSGTGHPCLGQVIMLDLLVHEFSPENLYSRHEQQASGRMKRIAL